MRFVYRGLRLAVLICVLVAATTTPAQADTQVTRPGAAVVKRALVKVWDLDRENSVDKITLTFKSLKLMPTRRAIPPDLVEGTWVTPVASVFLQRIVTTSPNILTGGTDRYCLTYRVNFTGIFWKGDFGWMFKNRNVIAKRISSTC
jgi:hypothetical protein